jgi:hypothetical protein
MPQANAKLSPVDSSTATVPAASPYPSGTMTIGTATIAENLSLDEAYQLEIKLIAQG